MSPGRPRFGIGIDTGGTFTKLVAVTPQGRARFELQVPTEAERGPRDFVRRVAAAVLDVERALGAKAAGVGMGIAGDVDSERGVIRFSPNLRRFDRFALGPSLSGALGRPVRVANDASMAAWGGFVVELRRQARNMVAIAMGTGIGGGLVIEGRLYHGSSGSAAELGHTLVESAGERCHCGARGCLEAYAGAYGIVRTARRLARGRRTILRAMEREAGALDPRLIFLAAARGDAVAAEVWRVTGTYLGIGIVNVVYTLNPDAVVIAGGVSRAGRLILDPVRGVLARQPFRTPFRRARVRLARTPNLGAIGAGLLGLE